LFQVIIGTVMMALVVIMGHPLEQVLALASLAAAYLYWSAPSRIDRWFAYVCIILSVAALLLFAVNSGAFN
jgi:hypothetical protein